jgi:hypothetical protein
LCDVACNVNVLKMSWNVMECTYKTHHIVTQYHSPTKPHLHTTPHNHQITTKLPQKQYQKTGFNPFAARNASKAAEGLCTWTRAMIDYNDASKIVKPKLEALRLAEARWAMDYFLHSYSHCSAFAPPFIAQYSTHSLTHSLLLKH